MGFGFLITANHRIFKGDTLKKLNGYFMLQSTITYWLFLNIFLFNTNHYQRYYFDQPQKKIVKITSVIVNLNKNKMINQKEN